MFQKTNLEDNSTTESLNEVPHPHGSRVLKLGGKFHVKSYYLLVYDNTPT